MKQYIPFYLNIHQKTFYSFYKNNFYIFRLYHLYLCIADNHSYIFLYIYTLYIHRIYLLSEQQIQFLFAFHLLFLSDHNYNFLYNNHLSYKSHTETRFHLLRQHSESHMFHAVHRILVDIQVIWLCNCQIVLYMVVHFFFPVFIP